MFRFKLMPHQIRDDIPQFLFLIYALQSKEFLMKYYFNSDENNNAKRTLRNVKFLMKCTIYITTYYMTVLNVISKKK